MTKASEILLLDSFITKLGDHSYLGPWLKRARPMMVWCIKNDLSIYIPDIVQVTEEVKP